MVSGQMEVRWGVSRMAEDASALVWKTCRSDRVVRGSRDEYDGIDGGNERLDRLGSAKCGLASRSCCLCAEPRRRLTHDLLLAISSVASSSARSLSRLILLFLAASSVWLRVSS